MSGAFRGHNMGTFVGARCGRRAQSVRGLTTSCTGRNSTRSATMKAAPTEAPPVGQRFSLHAKATASASPAKKRTPHREGRFLSFLSHRWAGGRRARRGPQVLPAACARRPLIIGRHDAQLSARDRSGTCPLSFAGRSSPEARCRRSRPGSRHPAVRCRRAARFQRPRGARTSVRIPRSQSPRPCRWSRTSGA